MDRDDPEKRIAELERHVAQRNRGAEVQRQLAAQNPAASGEGQPPLPAAAQTGAPGYPHGSPAQGRPPRPGAPAGTGYPPAYPGQAVPWGQAGFARPPRPRALTPWVVLGFVGLVMFSGVAAFVLTLIVDPSSAEWTGGILCDSGYHLEGREQATTILPAMQYTTPSSTTAYSTLFTCVNGNNGYALSDSGPVVGLQALAIMVIVGLPLSVATAVWAMIRRLQRNPR